MESPMPHEPLSSTYPYKYRVFLSFRGETRKNFTDHLHAALVNAGISTFLDEHGIERGEHIAVEINRAIEESEIAIVVFSKDYASSTWCLDELARIMDRRREVGQKVIPVLYNVRSGDISAQTGSFAEAFHIHEVKFKDQMDRVDRWQAALREVSELAAMGSKDGYEAQFIQEIVQVVRYKMNHTPTYASPFLGFNYLERIKSFGLNDGSKIGIIYGPKNVGKTIMAKLVYNQISVNFDGGSFLANIRETSKQPNGLVNLQRKLLSDILKVKENKIQSIEEGIIKIRDALSYRRVLVVLDDIDEPDLLEKIIGAQDSLFKGSKIIITATTESLSSVYEPCVKFKVEPSLGSNFYKHLFEVGKACLSSVYQKRKLMRRRNNTKEARTIAAAGNTG